MKIKVGTRGSRLAMAQTHIALSALTRAQPKIQFDIVTISTKGDIDKRPLFTMDQKGIFEKEVNQAVIRGDVDFAVHSLKDIPSDLSDELIVACIPKRGKPNDVLVNDKDLRLRDLDKYSIVGTSSLRRAVQIRSKRRDLVVRPIRGNVETRVKKVIAGEYDAIVLAEAGLTRLGMKDVIVERFGIRDFVPSPGQGAIAVVCKRDRKQLIKALKAIEDPLSKAEITAERAVLTKIEGGCRFPLGAVAVGSPYESKIVLYASVFSSDGETGITIKRKGEKAFPEDLGLKVGEMLIAKGAIELSKSWRGAVEEWSKK